MFLPFPLSQECPQVMLRNIRWLQFPLKSLSFCLTALWEMFTLPFLKQLFYSSGMQTAGAEKTIISQGTKGQMLPSPLSCMWNPQLFIFIGKLTSRAVPEGREAGEAALLTPRRENTGVRSQPWSHGHVKKPHAVRDAHVHRSMWQNSRWVKQSHCDTEVRGSSLAGRQGMHSRWEVPSQHLHITV